MTPEQEYLKSKGLTETNGVIEFTMEALEVLLRDYKNEVVSFYQLHIQQKI